MKRKATEELIAGRPPPMPEETELQRPKTAAMTTAISSTDVDVDFKIEDNESIHDDNQSETPVTTAHTPASASSVPSVSAVTATTAASRRFPSDLKTIRCTWPDCDKTFNRPARLTAHMRSHTNDRPYKCPDCPKTYLEEKHLRQHVKGSHTEERKYVCEECSKAFLTATRLRRHSAVHEGQDRFRCKGHDDTCTRTFRKHQTLQRHIRVDHLKQPAFFCTHVTEDKSPGQETKKKTKGKKPDRETCGAMFDSAGALRRHVEREHAAPKFWCEECASVKSDAFEIAEGVGFATKQLLESHMRHEHANCPFCDARCAGPAELHKHVDMHHSGKTVADRKTIRCPYAGCSKTFTRRANLNVHIRAAHEGLRFVCGTSGRGGSADVDDDDDADAGLDANASLSASLLASTSANPEIVAWHLRNEGCGRGFVSKMKLEEHILYVHLGHERPAPLKAEPALLDGAADFSPGANSDTIADIVDTHDIALEASIIDALLGTNRTLACTVSGCTARFVRNHDLNVHIQRDHFVDDANIDDVDVNDVGSEFNPDEFWIGGGDLADDSPLIPAGEDMFGSFIDMNAGLLSTANPMAGLNMNTNMGMNMNLNMNINMDEVQWQMDEAEMRRLIGPDGGASGEVANNNAGDNGNGDTTYLDPDLFL
ncbi:c2h2 transcription factor [Ophiostoma piceae UAMH 11346]|uniref:C2h2 transcription factor n=1 Tax=Ophiostoma piceae (strain UAMH 11346) TaxID=1262450 RepID=S3BQ45_OPHP1|nr:c2h2 transcription factor [Ophiostoma piceae UAMH 11346]